MKKTKNTNRHNQEHETKETSAKNASYKQRGLRLLYGLANTSLPEIAFVWTFVLTRYYSNIDFSYPSELIGPFVLLAIMATIVYYLFRLVLPRLAAHIAALPVVYLLYSFQLYRGRIDGLIAALLPEGLETPFAKALLFTVVCMIVFGVIGWALSKLAHARKLASLQLPKVLMFVILFLFVSQVFKVGAKVVSIWPELTYHAQLSIPAKDSSKQVTKPDIYYLVFDRYTNPESLQREYNYDNSAIMNYLNDQGLVTRKNAYSNYAFTVSSISSTMTMEYHTELGKKFGNNSYQTAFPYRNILNHPPVAQILQKEGYSYNQVSSWSDYTRLVPIADTNPSRSFRLSTFGFEYFPSDLSRDIINKSILSPMLKKGITIGKSHIIKYDLDRNPFENFASQMSALKAIAKNKTNQPQFSFAHVLVPHDPYIFNADGSPAAYSSDRNDQGVDEKVKYTNQVTYLNTQLKDLIGSIRKDSPDAVIIIQSDEGSYPKDFRFKLTPTHHYNPINLDVPKMQQKFGIITGYYMPGVDRATVEKEVNASVNPFRFVLSHYLGYDLDPLPDCHFASGNKFNLFHFQLVTDKLTGQPNPAACSQY